MEIAPSSLETVLKNICEIVRNYTLPFDLIPSPNVPDLYESAVDIIRNMISGIDPEWHRNKNPSSLNQDDKAKWLLSQLAMIFKVKQWNDVETWKSNVMEAFPNFSIKFEELSPKRPNGLPPGFTGLPPGFQMNFMPGFSPGGGRGGF